MLSPDYPYGQSSLSGNLTPNSACLTPNGHSPHASATKNPETPVSLHNHSFGNKTSEPSFHATEFSFGSLNQSISSGATATHGRLPARPPKRPTRLQRRGTKVDFVRMRRGCFSLDVDVAPSLFQAGAVTDPSLPEHHTLRYTGVTCDPDDYVARGYQLRLTNKKIELAVVVTMFNEDDKLFNRTMTAIMQNVVYMCRKRESPFPGTGWKQIVVCVVADGRSKIHPNVLTMLGVMGVYQDGVAVSEVSGKPVTAHVYEYTTQTVVTPELNILTARDGVPPMQIIFCLKEKNAKKINSHRWFYNAFCASMRPEATVLLDVGTRPREKALYKLWKAFDRDPKVAGACGEITVDYSSCFNLMKPLVAAQNFEYKMSNILDKPLESVFGYISVLPGAFSAYRYSALLPKRGKGPLVSYFKGEKRSGAETDVFTANMYLAEDRILCFELAAMKDDAWTLYYDRSAKADTDVPQDVSEFINQRRRWLNGSNFAAIYALNNVKQFWCSGHGLTRKFFVTLLFLYTFLKLLFSYFGLANFYLAFHFLASGFVADLAEEVTASRETLAWVVNLLKPVYMFSLIVQFVSSIGNRPQGARGIYRLTIALFSVIMLGMLAIMAYTIYRTAPKTIEEWRAKPLGDDEFRDVALAVSTTYGVYLISSILYGQPFHILSSMLQYLILLPTYVNSLTIFAYCNISDVSWGTKGGDDQPQHLGKASFKSTGKLKEEEEAFAEVQIPLDQDEQHKERLSKIESMQMHGRPEQPKPKKSLDDYYKRFRTRFLVLWIFSNGALVTAVIAPETFNTKLPINYLEFLLYAVAIMSIIRFCGSLAYLFKAAILKPFRKSQFKGRRRNAALPV